MSVRPTHSTSAQPQEQLRAQPGSDLKFEDLSETEKSAATIGVHPDAWKPISWLNAGHYTELLKNNSIGGRLTQQIEAFKVVASGSQ
jgi:hypothetical protein